MFQRPRAQPAKLAQPATHTHLTLAWAAADGTDRAPRGAKWEACHLSPSRLLLLCYRNLTVVSPARCVRDRAPHFCIPPPPRKYTDTYIARLTWACRARHSHARSDDAPTHTLTPFEIGHTLITIKRKTYEKFESQSHATIPHSLSRDGGGRSALHRWAAEAHGPRRLHRQSLAGTWTVQRRPKQLPCRISIVYPSYHIHIQSRLHTTHTLTCASATAPVAGLVSIFARTLILVLLAACGRVRVSARFLYIPHKGLLFTEYVSLSNLFRPVYFASIRLHESETNW